MSSKKQKVKKKAKGLKTEGVNTSSELDSSNYTVLENSQLSSSLRSQGHFVEHRLKNVACEWFNVTGKWNQSRSKGSAILEKIANIKIESFGEEPNSLHIVESLMPLSDKLKSVIQELESLVSKMDALTFSLQALALVDDVVALQGSPVLLTWPITRFVEASVNMADSYRKELECKSAIYAGVAHMSSRPALVVYTSAWLHEPYLDTQENNRSLEAMLLETGYK